MMAVQCQVCSVAPIGGVFWTHPVAGAGGSLLGDPSPIRKTKLYLSAQKTQYCCSTCHCTHTEEHGVTNA